MKKILSLISLCLTAAMMLSVCAFAADGDAALPFRDVGAGEWYYGNVKYVYENGIMKGTSDTEFSPDGTLTRAMCVAILHRAAGEPTVNVKLKFTDLAPGEYYEKPVIWAFARGIVKGRTENEFVPDGNITRAEFATMLFRYMKASRLTLTETNDSVPTDADKIPEFAADAVYALYRAGIVTGKGGGVFDPGADITRAETAAMIERFQRSAIDTMENPVFDDGVLDIAYIGNSFTYVPKIQDHFEAIAEGKHEIKTHMRTHPGWMLSDHYDKWSKRSEDTISYMARDWDVIVLNDAGNIELLQLREDFIEQYESLPEETKAKYSFDAYYQQVRNTLRSDEYFKLFTEMFGPDKIYYNLCESSFSKNGSNEKYFRWRNWLRDNCGINRIMLNITGFDPALRLDPNDFYYYPEDFHPNNLYGYCYALALYCTIYDEPCIVQNNGILTDDDIPGGTPEEKEAYMIMIKNLIQEQLDFEKAH
ncbi:MAG: S-layer homology domain-containing protein [Clostridia bacterium]|nr:S-layer homology domain-containing protein [Clostridia bacterium]